MNNPLAGNWPKAILLDFYGTLVEEIRAPVRDICRRIGPVPAEGIIDSEVVKHWAGVFLDLCAQSYGPAFRLQKELEKCSLQAALDHFHIDLDAGPLSLLLSDYRSRPVIYPESRMVLSRCRVPVCLLTNIDNREIERALEYTGLRFDYIVTSEDCRAYKPRPETFREALSRLDLPAQAVLHVGDSLHSDIMGAHQIGIPALWINRRKQLLLPDDFKTEASRPEYSSCNLTGLLDIID
ncbi:MAG: HAD family hydrolase [Dehalococcoidales bacterium]|nr:HAD family hydrolase [Dehalococcoidales bacterium]